MKFVKEEEEDRDDYILQKNKLTTNTAKFIIGVLIALAIAVIATGFYLGVF
ncbi:hypothetical protein [uncultured Dokdonia sp.]|uniref:hypothetical protein n=1 Tax=uncultured Dokdonia sp. TaxID=575653 RepID=UPI00261E023F|nr:hypothetical protein [uncultured Dokdonia sp.]